MNTDTCHFKSLEEIQRKNRELGLGLHFSTHIESLGQPVRVDGIPFSNSLAVHPMEGCDANADGTPGERTKRRYARYAAGGAGLIWLEATAVCESGRASPRQLWLNRQTVGRFAELREEIARAARNAPDGAGNPVCILQLTHSGRFSKPTGRPAPVIAYHDPYLSRLHIDDRDIQPVTDDELERLEEQMENAAVLAKEAGFDGVDVKCCHRYLASELLSAFDRDGKFGGSFENRTRLLRETAARIRGRVGPSLLVTTRLNLYDGFPLPHAWGAGKNADEVELEEPLRLIRELHADGMNLISLTMGCPYINPHVNRPSNHYDKPSTENPLVGVARLVDGTRRVQNAIRDLTVVGVGYSWLGEFSPYLAAGEKEQNGVGIVGYGRESFAYPDFAADICRTGRLKKEKCCIACGKCTELMRAGKAVGCVIRGPEFYRKEYREIIQNANRRKNTP